MFYDGTLRISGLCIAEDHAKEGFSNKKESVL